MAGRQLSLPGPLVKKSNALARASWSVRSVYEPRLVALVASQVRSDDQDFQDYVIPLSDLLGSSPDGRTRQLVADVVEGLLGRVLTLPRPNGWAKCNVFSWCEFDSKAGCIRARFDPGLKEHYLNLKSQFTQYSLIEFLLLPSTYSQRLFEVLKSWSNLPDVIIPLVELFTMLDVPISFQRYPDFRRKVLERAYKDIHEKTALRYAWIPIKKGRAVYSIRFVFSSYSETVKNEAEDRKKQKKSDENNSLLKKAVECFRENGSFCVPTKNKTCDICVRLVRTNGSSSTLKEDISPSQMIGALLTCGLSRQDADLFVKMLSGTGKLQTAWDLLPSIKKRFQSLPKSQRKGLGQFVRKTLRSEIYSE